VTFPLGRIREITFVGVIAEDKVHSLGIRSLASTKFGE
jgi:hypothetical protein